MRRARSEFPLRRSGFMIQFASVEALAQSPAHTMGLRIGHCCSCSVGRSCDSGLILGPAAPCASGQPAEKKINKRKRAESLWKGFWMWELAVGLVEGGAVDPGGDGLGIGATARRGSGRLPGAAQGSGVKVPCQEQGRAAGRRS